MWKSKQITFLPNLFIKLNQEIVMKGQVQAIIGLMVVLLIGVAVAVPVVTDTVNTATQSVTVTDEQLAGINGTSETLDYPKLVSGLTVYNQSGGVGEITSGNYSLDSTNGVITWTNLNNTLYPAPQYANYTGHSTAYQTNGTSRTLLNILPLLVVVALVLVVVGWMKFR